MSPVYSSLSSSSSSSSSQQHRRQRNQTQTLIPGLPNDVASLILSFVPYSHQSRLKLVCKSWRSFLSSNTVFTLRQRHEPRRLSHLLCIFPRDPSISSPCLFDPQSLAWCALPELPPNPQAYGLCNFRSVSVGPHLYVIGGSLFDARSYPLDRPCPSGAAFRFDFGRYRWECLTPMSIPRGSFACAALRDKGQILVAGGGSRHTLFGAAGSRVSSVERYDIQRNEWVEMEELPRFRAGCVGFVVENEGEDGKFWVMGGYGERRRVGGVFPVDEYYKDAVMMKLENGGRSSKWTEVGNMWEDGERFRLGKIAVVEDEDGRKPDVFMLEGTNIFRYDMAVNRWQKESSLPRYTSNNLAYGLVGLDGELHVLNLLVGSDLPELRRPRQHKRAGTVHVQIYHPKQKTWRSLITKLPFNYPIDFHTSVLCTIRL